MAKLVDVQNEWTSDVLSWFPQYRRTILLEGECISGRERYDLFFHTNETGYVIDMLKLHGEKMTFLSTLDVPRASLGKMIAYAENVFAQITEEFKKGVVPDLRNLVLN